MAISQKTGNGGNGQEAYNTENGQYVASSGVTEDEVKDYILSGGFGDDLKDIFSTCDEKTKNSIIKDIMSEASSIATEDKMSERYETLSDSEFEEWGEECKKLLTQHEMDILWGKDDEDDPDEKIRQYIHGGRYCFELLKGARWGAEEYFKRVSTAAVFFKTPEYMAGLIQDLNNACEKFKAPRNCQAYRLLDENWVVSRFGNFLKDYEVIDDFLYRSSDYINFGIIEYTGYKTIDRNKYSVDQIVDSLQDIVGMKMDNDKAPTSVSFVQGATHMGSDDKFDSDETYKRIKVNYDIEKDTSMIVTENSYESEGLLSGNQKFFIKEVKKELNDDGRPIVSIYMGVNND